MKKLIVPVLIATAFTLAFTSCGSTPKTDKSSDLADKVNDVEQQVENTVEEVTTVDNASALEAAEAARKAALDAGADKVASEQFKAADALYNTLKAQSESGIDVTAALADVEKRYQALTAYAQALENKKKIEERELISYDKASYDEGCSALKEFEDLNSSTNLLGTLMLDKANNANGKFINVLNKAYKQLAKDARIEAFKAKRAADNVKAGVAAKEEYKKAADEFKAGDSAYSMQNAESAYFHYVASKDKFNKVAEDVAAKRAAAQQAIDEAKAKVEAAANYAAKADQVNPLEGDNIEGIEAEDAVLLEADEYAAPESQEAEIPEEIADFEIQEFESTDSSIETVIEDAVNDINKAAKEAK